MGWYQPIHSHVLRCVRPLRLGYRGESPGYNNCYLERDAYPSPITFDHDSLRHVQTLEKDFDGTEQAVIPELIAKLLYALTWNRQIK